MRSCYKKKLNEELSQAVDGSILVNLQEILKGSFDKYIVFVNEFVCCCSTFLNPDYRDMSHCTGDVKETTVLLAKKFLIESFAESNLIEINVEISTLEPSRIEK